MKVLKGVRWEVTQASVEFDLHKATLSKRLKTAGIEPGEDGKFSTKQICAAVFGDMDGEKLRVERHRANLLEIEEKEKRNELVSVAAVDRVWRSYLIATRQHVRNHQKIPEDLKSEILLELREIPAQEYFKETIGKEDGE